jgi:5-methylcytosine-specific restriction protein B
MGTMNTADKSLALLDVALRRRFEFKGLFPKENLVKDEKKRKLFNIINNNILKKKGIDFQIGHSYFMEGDLKTIINCKVLPLLDEYFRGDNKEIKEVFTDTINETKIIVNQNGIEEKDGVLTYVGEVVNKDFEQ